MNHLTMIVLPALLTAASASFAVDYGDCYGVFHFTDRKSQEFCKAEISDRQCADLVEHYERRFKEKYPSFYHARLVRDTTNARNGCAYSKSFPK